jgi:two-component system, cell cycle sensor histidine kinase and response regulator CckA
MEKMIIEEKPLRVLCLEDTPQDAEIMRELLTNAGFVLDMDCTDKEKEFVSFLRTRTYDIILSDFKLPGFDGFAALHWAMEICPKVPFICVSGTIGEEKAVELLKQGAVDYVIKDRLARLPATIKRALDEAKEKEVRQKTEEKLNKNLRLLAETEKIGKVGGWEFNIDTGVQHWTEEVCNIHEVELSYEPTVEKGVSFYTPVSRPIIEKAVQRTIEVGEPFDLELEIITAKGNVRQVHAIGKRDLEYRRVYGFFQDITERKQAEKVLSDLIEKNPMSIQIVDKNGFTLKINSSHTMLFGSVPPSDFSIFTDLQNKGLGEYILLAKKGEVVHFPDVCYNVHDVFSELPDKPAWIRAVLFPLTNSGIVEKFVFMHEDITERKRAEEALRESETNFRSLFENSLMGISSATPDGRLIKANMAYARMYGYENPNEMMAEVTNVGKLYANPGDCKEVLRILAEKGVMEPREVEVVRRDGTKFFVLVSACAMRDASGKILYSQANYIDITERKRTGEELRESEERYRSLATFSPDSIYVHIDNRVVLVNPAFCQLLGATDPSQLIGKSVFEIVHPDYHNKLHERWNQVFSGQTAPLLEEKFIRLDGTLVDVEAHAVAIDMKGSKGVQVIVRNITERKLAEEALRESEERFRSLYENAAIGLYRTTPDGTILLANRALAKMLDYPSLEKLMKKNLEKDGFEPSYQRNEFLEEIERDGEINGRESKWILQDGTVIFVRESARAIRDAQGKTLYYDGMVENITQRKYAEEALSNERNLLHTLIDALPDRIFVKDINGKFVLNNVAHLKALGVNSQEETLGKTDYDFRPKEFADRFALSDKKILQTGKPIISSEEQSVSVSGEIGWMLSNKVPLRDTQGTIIGLVGNSHDITERKRIDEDIRKLSTAVEQSGSSIVITDTKGNIEYVNPKFVELTGYSMQEVIGKNPRILKSDHSSSEEYKNLWNTILNGQVWHGEFHNKKKNGDLFWESATVSPVRAVDGKITHFIAVKEDITQQKAMADQLRQMQKLEGLGTLAGGIAHDFNNILGIILAYITDVHRSKDDTKKLNLAVDTIVKAVERGKTLVQQILTFARKKETTFGAVNVNEVVMEIMTMIFETFPKTLTYGQNFDKSISYINADRSQLHQALLNLCVNARDAMPRGGVLTLTTRVVSGTILRNQYHDAYASSYVCVEVNDTGEGMTQVTQERIFEPFFTTKVQGKGTGLGLAVVFGVIQTHKGFIDVESVLGKGTTFRLYLPATQAAKPVSVKDEETLDKITGGTETILVVEDEEMLMMSLKIVLVEKGYNVITTGDGLAAVDMYKERKKEIALVLTDLGLPKMNGMDVCTQVKKINPNMRMIVATGFLDPGMKSEFLKAGIRHFLYKPYNLLEVLKLVREVLDEK